MKNLITLAASFLVLLPNLALAEGSEHCDSRGWCQCPGGVAASRCLRNYASCSEACGLSSGSASASPGSYSSLQQMQLGIAKQVGTSLGTAVGEVLFGNPQQDAARQAAAAQAAEQQRLAAEQRAAEATRQQELAKQRIFGLLKGAESATGLALKMDDADSTLIVAQTPGSLGSNVIVPIRTDSPPAERGLQLKLGDEADRASMQAGQGFDTAGKIIGSNLSPPPPTPGSSSLPQAEKKQLLTALRTKLTDSEAKVQSLKDQLVQLQQAPTPDLIEINQVQNKLIEAFTTNTQLTQNIERVTAGEANIGFEEENISTGNAPAVSSLSQ